MVSAYSILEVFSLSSKLSFSLISFLAIATPILGAFSTYRHEPSSQAFALRDSYLRVFNLFFLFFSFSLSMSSFYYFYMYLLSNPGVAGSGYTFFLLDSLEFEWSSVSLSLDLFGSILIFLAYLVGIFSLASLDTRLPRVGYRFYSYFNFFLVFVYVYTMSTDLIVFFVSYELLLLPSFFFVYFVSYSKKAIQASLYFVMWTQLGSILVLLCSVYIFRVVGSTSFSVIKSFPLLGSESLIALSLLFFGFGFKVPIWPFHYWLTKTHVEAPSGFSIYLSGFLVKSALFGLFKLSGLIFSDLSTFFFFTIASLGCIDASFKLWGQGDLKKIVAYCTVQEMNLILLTLLWGDSFAVVCGFIFSAAHAFLSALMFYVVDCVYRRYHSRSVYSVSGVFTLYPRLGSIIFFMLVVFGGLPGTLKFSCEFFIFSNLLSVSWPSCVFLVFVLNFFGLVGFSKAWLNALFGLPNPRVESPAMDLSRKETSLCMFSILFLVYSSYFFFLVF